ncbi:LysM domain-containing protein [Neobacillus notoginsengisoli]|uniref:LysM domain-containing protein n=1 Tax=Neobacillus notoginsengisoli TaxID=1578198 RepID=A0A417YUS0_9BACI|nr:LysM domain-containing protein [Neobacillus notoginsengisoli]RHW41046.1 LysM domain-containing protein [Neobacillus notoginsengisoli]
MKKIAVALFIFALIISVYTDLTKGTLPVSKPGFAVAKTEPSSELPFYKATVQPGQTLLSIVEQNQGAIPVPIKKMVEDFQVLNPGASPEKLQIGKEYFFPSYSKEGS